MDSDFEELIKKARDYEFDPGKLGAIALTGSLRKSANPGNCILVISSGPIGDVSVEVAVSDILAHTISADGVSSKDLVTIGVRPTAIITTSIRTSISIYHSSGGPSVTQELLSRNMRERITIPWREVFKVPSTVDVILNWASRLAWVECRARGQAECESRYPPGVDRDRCVTQKHLECGPPPRLDVDERVLEQLVELLRVAIRR